ncbi:FixH family protein [Rhodobacter sp. SGA-6-6]|uniref:FixH family protein n=1 Tax=Rhodobacter sp. SGA-6-6 TaxID=2710882 RepID=UPI0013EC2DC9|nr:FixH family protein [Rhodobacter sp. SGA-6-6]NGM44741.1 FixH family protein [Rhodobacter sp. SGA-6-6]
MAEITGRQVAVFTVGAFGIIIAVNLVMAWQAVSTFPGLEAPNTFVASQEFDARREAQEKLGWTVAPTHENGRVRLAITNAAGRPVEVASLQVLIGRPTSARDDVTPDFAFVGGVYEAPVELAPGQWMLKLEAVAQDGTLFEQRFDLRVKG